MKPPVRLRAVEHQSECGVLAVACPRYDAEYEGLERMTEEGPVFVNASQALLAKTQEALIGGTRVSVRNSDTLELRHQHLTLANPLDRCIVVQGRRNNVFAAIAETLWVIAGRNDIGFLTPYLPRAIDFSDDGTTWRAGYGPRLRNWKGTDQIAEIVALLRHDPTSRRAVISIFDPAVDFLPSKDIPCTNWLSFSLRDGVLDLSVAVRSNDLMWGFSGINTFEWSVLQEMVARWLGAEVGRVDYSITSLHLYQRHIPRAMDILGAGRLSSQWSRNGHSRFDTDLAGIDDALRDWFAAERAIREQGADSTDLAGIGDPLLRDFILMIGAYWTFHRSGRSAGEESLKLVSDASLVAAGMDYMSWKSEDPLVLHSVDSLDLEELKFAIQALHFQKDAMYGDSWKRRGEQMAIMANIARKLDRLGRIETDDPDTSLEPWFDTAVDLFVYALKYQAFLIDRSGFLPPPAHAQSWSDGPWGFDALLAELPESTRVFADLQEAAVSLESTFAEIDALLKIGDSGNNRIGLVASLVDQSLATLQMVFALNPAVNRREMDRWILTSDQRRKDLQG